MRRPLTEREIRRRRRVIIVATAILVIIGGVVGYGFYDRFVVPPEVLAARVGDRSYTQGDLVKRIRMLQADAAAGGQPFAAGRAPFKVLTEMYEAGVIRRNAPSLGIQLSSAEVEAGLAVRFGPRIVEGQEVSREQIRREYKEAYQAFLNSRHLSDSDYRDLLEERIYRVKVRERLGEEVPLVGRHVEVHWIKLPSQIDASTAGSQPPAPEVIRARLNKEDFADLAREVSSDLVFADRKGYVGWLPQGAFPDLDQFLFGSDDREPVALDEVTPPIVTREGTYILKVTAGPEEREVSAIMYAQLKEERLKEWLSDEVSVGGGEGWFELKWNSDLYAWVVKQVSQAAPRTTAPAGGQG